MATSNTATTGTRHVPVFDGEPEEDQQDQPGYRNPQAATFSPRGPLDTHSDDPLGTRTPGHPLEPSSVGPWGL